MQQGLYFNNAQIQNQNEEDEPGIHISQEEQVHEQQNEQENKQESKRVARVRRQNQISPNQPYQPASVLQNPRRAQRRHSVQ